EHRQHPDREACAFGGARRRPTLGAGERAPGTPAGNGRAVTKRADPVLTAIAQAAVGATGASHGWVLLLTDDQLEVSAAVGDGATKLIGRRVDAGSGTSGYVAASGQPLALAGSAGDPRLAEGVVAELGQRPASLLCVPCATDDRIVGVLELIDKDGGERFSFDAVELVTLLGGIA